MAFLTKAGVPQCVWRQYVFTLSCSYLDFARLSMWLDGFLYRPRARVSFSDLAVACRLA